MHDEPYTNDEVLFDRLVDGELSPEARRQLLASLDDRPGGWRQCALAFLEAQAWRSNMRQIAQPQVAAPSPTASKKGAPAAERRSIRRRAGQWLAVAASLLIAFGLGSTWREWLPSFSQSVGPQPGRIAGSNAPGPSGTQSANDALTFWVQDNAGGAQSVQVPLVEASTLNHQLGLEFRSGMPDQVREQLRQNGYDVQSKRRYAPLWLDNGGSLVVPVEDTRIVPISPVVY